MLLHDTYELFSKYKINTSIEDFDLIDGLSFSYEKLITQAEEVSDKITLNYIQWKIDYINGTLSIKYDLEQFEDEFFDFVDETEDLSSKVAKDKVSIF